MATPIAEDHTPDAPRPCARPGCGGNAVGTMWNGQERQFCSGTCRELRLTQLSLSNLINVAEARGNVTPTYLAALRLETDALDRAMDAWSEFVVVREAAYATRRADTGRRA